MSADIVPIAPTCHVCSFPPQNQPRGSVLTACVKSNVSLIIEMISIRCVLSSRAIASLETKKKHSNISRNRLTNQ